MEVAGSITMLLTILIHVRVEALGEPAGAALVPVRLVHGTATLHLATRFAGVHSVPMDRPLEETGTA